MAKKGILLTAVAAIGLVFISFGAVSAKTNLGIAAVADQARQAGFPAAEGAIPKSPAIPPSSPAPQAGPSVTITSFVLTGQNSRVAEICGKVAGAASDFTVVRVTVDPNSKNPGTYNTLAGRDGAFCAMVVTYYGTADASAAALNKGTSAMASLKNSRD